MGAWYKYVCDTCGYTVETSGLWEFYRDDCGERQSYGHPVPVSREAVERGIAGLSAELYCASCDEVFDLVVLEFKEPYKGDTFWLVVRNLDLKDEYRGEDPVRCPECGSADLILGRSEEKEIVPCPRCGKGGLSGGMERIS